MLGAELLVLVCVSHSRVGLSQVLEFDADDLTVVRRPGDLRLVLDKDLVILSVVVIVIEV